MFHKSYESVEDYLNEAPHHTVLVDIPNVATKRSYFGLSVANSAERAVLAAIQAEEMEPESVVTTAYWPCGKIWNDVEIEISLVAKAVNLRGRKTKEFERQQAASENGITVKNGDCPVTSTVRAALYCTDLKPSEDDVAGIVASIKEDFPELND